MTGAQRAAALDAAVAAGYCVLTPASFDRALASIQERAYRAGLSDGRAEIMSLRRKP